MKSIVAVLFVVFVSLISIPVQAVTQYKVTDLGTLGGTSSYAHDINNFGVVVGEARLGNGSTHAFAFNGSGPLHDLGTVGGTFSAAMSVNDSGQIVGYSYASNTYQHAFVSDGVAPMNDLGTAGATASWAYGVNNKGQIIGYTVDLTGPTSAAIFVGNNQVTRIPGINTSDFSIGEAINDNGSIVGYYNTTTGQTHSFFYDGVNPPRDLGSFGGGYSRALDINNKGQIVGDSDDSSNHVQAFITDGVNPLRSLGTLGGDYSTAWAINNFGTIVGESSLTKGTSHAFIAGSEGTMQDLNNLIPQSSEWTLNSAKGINDLGQIFGSGTIRGQTHAFLLTPVPEPSTLALLGMGGIGMMAYGWRRKR